MNNKTKDYVLMAMYAALAMALKYVGEFIPFLQMPQGGSIEIELIPIFMASYQLGWKKGVITGLVWWLMGFMMGFNNWYLTPVQYVLDYIVPLSICGLASLIPNIKNLYLGVIVTMVLKYMSHVLAGVYFWFPETTYAGSLESWVYSLGYNVWYCLATAIVCIIVVPVLAKRLGSRFSNK